MKRANVGDVVVMRAGVCAMPVRAMARAMGVTRGPVTVAGRATTARTACTETGHCHRAESDAAERETECVEIHRSCGPRVLSCTRDTTESYVFVTARARPPSLRPARTPPNTGTFFQRTQGAGLRAAYNADR